MLQGKKHNAPVLLGFENSEAVIKIAGHSISLLELLFIEDVQCSIDSKKLKSLADNPTGLADDKESTEARQDRLLARKRELISLGVKNFNQRIKNEEGLSLSQVRKIISAAEFREKSLPNKWLSIAGLVK